MAKHETTDPSKKEKKDKKRKSDAVDDVAKAEKKKEKKARKSLDASAVDVDVSMVEADAAQDLTEEKPVVKADGTVAAPLAALVPFAHPLCDEKSQKKVLKGVKKAAKSKSLKRGVKEVLKSVRKSPPSNPSSLTPSTLPPGIVILAADISPMDVISHLPVLCEDHGIPYLFVPSRAELGAAGSTKRPTSVVMLTPGVGKGVEASEEWEETYKELYKLALKLGQTVKV